MTTPTERVAAESRRVVRRLSGRRVTLQRVVGGSTVLGVSENATIGMTSDQEYNTENIIISTRYRDYLIDVDDYKFAGEVAEPLIDDKIIETIDGEVVTFQVLPTAGAPHARYHDATRKTWRVHTRELRVD